MIDLAGGRRQQPDDHLARRSICREPDSPTSAKVSRSRDLEGDARRPPSAAGAARRSSMRLSQGFETSKMRPRSSTLTSALRLRGGARRVDVALMTRAACTGSDVEPARDLRALLALQVGPVARRSGDERVRAARMEGAAGRDRGQARHRARDLRQPFGARRRASGSSPSGRACRDAAARLITSRTGPISTMRPAYITATRSAVSAITPMSWVISMMAVPCSRHSRFSSAMICAWTETSSAVVGSSAMTSSRLGGERQREHDALAHAAGELVRIGVDPRVSAAGMPTSSSSASARLRAPARRSASEWVRMVSIELLADRYSGLSAGQRVLEDHADALAADACASPRAADCRCARPSGSTSPPAMRPGGSSRPMIGGAGDRLAGAGFADDAEHLARRDVERDVVDRRQHAAARRKLDRAGFGRLRTRFGHRSFGLSASRSQSPNRLIDSASSDERRARGITRSTIRRRTGNCWPIADQRAERGLRRRHADAEERQRRLGEDRRARD